MSEHCFRDSGQDWLGSIPSHWNLHKLGAHFTERKVTVNDTDYPALSVTMQGIVPQLETAAKSDANDKRKLVLKGDFVINSRSDRKGSSGVSPLDGSVSQISIVLEPKGISPLYANYLLRSYPFQEEFYKWGSGIVADLWSTRFSAMKQILIPVPPQSEQDAIVEFLDRELASLEHSIEKLIELKNKVSEFRRATIVQAVQLGVESNPDTEPGPEPYLPKVRKDWGFGALKRFVEFGSGSGFPEIDQGIETEEIPFLKVNALGQAASDGLITVRTDTVSRSTSKRLGASVFPAGSLVMAKIGAALLLGRVGVLSEASCVDNNMMVVIPKSGQYPRYYYYMLQTLEFSSFVNPGAVPSTSGTAVGKQAVSNVPLAAQKSISDHLDAICETLDALSSRIEGSLGLLNERRSALISAAVTGKLELQGAN